MSVADSPFDSAWKIAKAPFYHSVNTDTSDPEVAEKLWALRDELMAEGITFDAGGGFPKGGRDWELDWSLSGATPDEVMIRMRDAGIPFTSTMRYVDELEPEAEARADQLNTYRDRKSDMEPVYQDAVGIGESKCPECGEMGMVIREPDESLTLACGDCGFMEEYQGGDFDEGVSKQFDQQRAEMARMQQAEQPPYVGDDEDLNLNIGGNEGDCCQNLSARFEEIFSGTPFDNGNGFMDGLVENFEESEGVYHWWDKSCDDYIGPIEVFNELVKPELEWILKNQPEMTPMVQGILNDALQAIQEYEACQRGGFGGVDFGGDFMASGDSFEDSWNIAKFDANRAEMARAVEQEQIPAEDEEVEVNLDGGGGEPDKCCVEAAQAYVELTGDNHPDLDNLTSEDCDELQEWLERIAQSEQMRNDFGDASKILAQWNACVESDFSGDFTASGDVFEDSWNIAKLRFTPFPPEAEPFLDAQDRMANQQEQIPAEDEEVNVDLNPNGGEPDKCCLEALQLYQELTGDYTQSNPWIWSKGVEGGTDGFGGGELDCDELRGWLEWLVYDDVDSPHGIEQQAAKKVLEQWESCISEDFSGDFTASGDVFEDAWSVAKKERCWLCEKVKDTYGRYPNLPYYPPNWKRPCDCAGDF